MQFTQSTVSLLPLLALVSGAAIPSAEPMAHIQKRGGYITSCTITNFDVPFLSALCRNNAGGETESTVNINNCIGNDNGIIVLGSGFTSSCGSFRTNGQLFGATCTDEAGGQVNNDNVDTNSFVTDNDGGLTC